MQNTNTTPKYKNKAAKNAEKREREERYDKAVEIGELNASCAIDQAQAPDYADTPYGAFAAYLVNTVDTARECRVNPETAVEAFNRYIEAERRASKKKEREILQTITQLRKNGATKNHVEALQQRLAQHRHRHALIF